MQLQSKAARQKLSPKAEPYWVRLTKGGHLGYRRLAQGGSWTVRYWDSLSSKHRYSALAAADDAIPSNGKTILSFDQAQQLAREWLDQQAIGVQRRGPYTISECMSDYLEWIRTHRKSYGHIKIYINAFILPHLGHIDVAKLTTVLIRKWHQQIASEPPRLRSGRSKVRRFRAEDANLKEAERKRRLRANRQLTILRAALNRAWSEGLIARNEAWARVKAFPNTERARSRYLTIEEARHLLAVCSPDLRDLVQLALLSGGRYAELGALLVSDFHPESGTLHVRESKSGKSRHIVLNKEGIALCIRLVANRPSSDSLLKKADGSPWKQDHQHRPFKDALRAAGLDPSFTFHGLRHTWASLTIMNGAELIVVAQNLGHRDTRMVERHYGHLAKSYVSDVIRRSSPRFIENPQEEIGGLTGPVADQLQMLPCN
ncbi:MAG: site-specific integrase [Rhodospirillaceae bacterium]|nr:MAG: site-specific integrase [Rhodospirillaceae bacterium]